jgi:hypothetical protein
MTNSDRVLRTQISGLKALFDAHLSHLEKALILRTNELDNKLVQMNEFRKDVESDRESFLRKEIFEARLESYSKCHENMERNLVLFKEFYQDAHARLINRVTIIETRLVTWTAALAAFFVVAQLALKYFDK